MSGSTKRKAPYLSKEGPDQDTSYGTDARPTKKVKQECAPSDGDRRDLPAATRTPGLMTGVSKL